MSWAFQFWMPPLVQICFGLFGESSPVCLLSYLLVNFLFRWSLWFLLPMLWVGLAQSFPRGSVPPALLLFSCLIAQLELLVASLLLDFLFPRFDINCRLSPASFNHLLSPGFGSQNIVPIRSPGNEIRELTPWVPKGNLPHSDDLHTGPLALGAQVPLRHCAWRFRPR